MDKGSPIGNAHGGSDAAAKAYLDRLSNDPLYFADQLWLDRGLDQYAPLGDMEYDAVAYAAGGVYRERGKPRWELDRRLPQYRGILAPRRFGKTHWGTATLSLYRLFRDHNRRILIPSKSHGEAKKTIRLIREWIDQVWFLQHLSPRRNQLDNRDMFEVGPADTNRQPSVMAIGMEGQLPGNRAHSIFPDDVETEKNTETLEARTKLDETVKEFKFILYGQRPTDDPDELVGMVDPVEIVYFGTYHHEESLYLKLNDRGYAFRTYPILYPSAGEEVLNLAPMLQRKLDRGEAKPGDITAPHRFTRKNISDFEAEGRRAFSMQCMLLKNLGDTLRYPLRLADIPVMELDHHQAPMTVTWGKRDHNGSTAVPVKSVGFGDDRFYRPVMLDKTFAPYTATKMAIDPSGRGADKTGVAILSHLNGMLFNRHTHGYEGGSSPEALEILASLAFKYNVREVLIEDNFGRGMFQQLLEPVLQKFFVLPGKHPQYPEGWGCSVTSFNATGQKELRIIDTLEPIFSTHRMVFDLSVAQNLDLQHQITRITRQPRCLPHEDELDALAACASAWMKELSLDPVANVQRLEKEQEELALRQFAEDCGLNDYHDRPSVPKGLVPTSSGSLYR